VRQARRRNANRKGLSKLFQRPACAGRQIANEIAPGILTGLTVESAGAFSFGLHQLRTGTAANWRVVEADVAGAT